MKLRNTLIGSLVFASFGVASADYPLLPPNGTDELYALEQECDCVLSITPDANISVLVSVDDILTLFGLDTSEQSNDDVRIFNHGIVVLDDGALVFGAQVRESVPDEADIVRDVLIKRQPDGTLEQLLARINTDDNDGGSFEGLVIGFDGFLYVMDDSNDSMLQVNANTGAFITYATKANFESVTSSVEFVATPSLAADENYLYVASDRIPNVIYRVNYDVMGGNNPVQDIYGAGPNGVDPAVLTPYDTTLYLFPSVPPLPPSGDFNIQLQRDNGTSETTADLPFNATALQVEAALEAAVGGDLTVTGAGTLLDPWRFLRPSEFTSVQMDDMDLVGLLTASRTDSQEAVPVDNHIEYVAVEATSGTFRLDIELTGVIGAGRTIADLELDFDVTASEIANALLAIDGIEVGDITVSGSGTIAAPWVFTFGGQFALTPVEMGVFEITDPDGISRVGSFVNSGALDDPDGFLTRQPDGNILVPDDSNGHFLYQLAVNSTPVESVTTLLTEWELVVANGGRANIEGGVAYDSNGA
ncbi:hypothetical protein, partial [Photobacterium sp. OFAV2-7]|uniref:hypothetical protein n=1 Tax=Photobacterium sp. OFAV2-7 TaxID=2917748 RepID=UPI001EF6D1B8